MLVTIFIATSLVGGGVFGFYAAHTYHTQRQKRVQKTAVEAAPTAVLEAELERRGTTETSVYR